MCQREGMWAGCNQQSTIEATWYGSMDRFQLGHPDVTIFRSCLAQELDDDERVEADDG